GQLTAFLREAPGQMCQALAAAPAPSQRDLLLALNDLRAEAADDLLPLLERPGFPHADLAVEVLTWSRDSRVGPWLRDWTRAKPAAPQLFARRFPLCGSTPGVARPPVARNRSLVDAGYAGLGPHVPGSRRQQPGLVGAGPPHRRVVLLAARSARSQPGGASG